MAQEVAGSSPVGHPSKGKRDAGFTPRPSSSVGRRGPECAYSAPPEGGVRVYVEQGDVAGGSPFGTHRLPAAAEQGAPGGDSWTTSKFSPTNESHASPTSFAAYSHHR